MWNAIYISEDLYKFQLEHTFSEEAGAMVALKVWEDRLEVNADIFLYYVPSKKAYELLLEAIRHFSQQKKHERERNDCLIHFHCKGLLDEIGDFTLPVAISFISSVLIDTEFYETTPYGLNYS